MSVERRGGYYEMDHASFGAMMVSEHVRPQLDYWTRLIALRAKVNTQASSGGSTELANAYEVEEGPIVVLVVDGKPSPRISNRVVNRMRYAAAREFGLGRARASLKGTRGNARKRAKSADVYGPAVKREGTRDLRRAGAAYGDSDGEAG